MQKLSKVWEYMIHMPIPTNTQKTQTQTKSNTTPNNLIGPKL